MLYIDTSDSTYPLTRADIEAATPGVIWGDDNPPAPYTTVLPALELPTPAAGEVLVEGDPEQVDGVWRQTWSVATATAKRRLTRLQYVLSLQHFGALEIVFNSVAELDPTDVVRLYFDHTDSFDRDDPRYTAMEIRLNAGPSDTDDVFAYGGTLAP